MLLFHQNQNAVLYITKIGHGEFCANLQRYRLSEKNLTPYCQNRTGRKVVLKKSLISNLEF